MSHSASGPCLVCGEETTSRCEACRQAGIDLFFCSREHQKLIWPVHKQVCGPGKANPFTWPPLSQSELEDAKQDLHYKVAYLGGHDLSLSDILTSTEAFLESLTEGRGDVSDPVRQQILLALRAHKIEHFRQLATSDPKVTVPNAVRIAASTLLRFSKGSGVLPVTLEASALHHLVLAMTGLAYAMEDLVRRGHARSSGAVVELGGFMLGSLERAKQDLAVLARKEPARWAAD
ncbi:hypothetical protein JCM8097_007696 [Rhodosporidiobolus ruineniae]